MVVLGVVLMAGMGRVNQGQYDMEPLALLATDTDTLSPTYTQTPTKTVTATPEETATPMYTLTPELGIGSTQVSSKDGMEMVEIPAGDFLMGSENGEDDEKPQHTVYLDAYWIDQTEVTNAMYTQCVADGVCEPPHTRVSYTRSSYYGDSFYDSYPVVNVDWNQANIYCGWAGRRLPSEAEWEKAARSTDGRTYPWGEQSPTCSLANFGGCEGDTTAVGSYPQGASVYGAVDMAGNVWEWVADWYQVYQGGDASASYAFGQTYRVLRGGSWYYEAWYLRSSYRYGYYPVYWGYVEFGFRCAR